MRGEERNASGEGEEGQEVTLVMVGAMATDGVEAATTVTEAVRRA